MRARYGREEGDIGVVGGREKLWRDCLTSESSGLSVGA